MLKNDDLYDPFRDDHQVSTWIFKSVKALETDTWQINARCQHEACFMSM